jgi:uncharacterized tellurite resistance protein B-like protein
MYTKPQARFLVKILIGVAWLDGKIQPEERQYLVKIAQKYHLDEDIEIHPLLEGTMTVTQADCEQWIQLYLGDRSINDDDRLIEDISGLIYSDGDVAIAEAKLLTDIQSEPSSAEPNKPMLVDKIRQLYQSWVEKLNQ